MNRSVGVSNPHASFAMSMFSHQTITVLKTLTFKLQPLILNRCLPNTFRSDHLFKSLDSLYISRRGRFGVFSPHISFFILMFFLWTSIVLLKLPFKLVMRCKILHLIEMTGGKYLSAPHIFVKMRHFRHY